MEDTRIKMCRKMNFRLLVGHAPKIILTEILESHLLTSNKEEPRESLGTDHVEKRQISWAGFCGMPTTKTDKPFLRTPRPPDLNIPTGPRIA